MVDWQGKFHAGSQSPQIPRTRQDSARLPGEPGISPLSVCPSLEGKTSSHYPIRSASHRESHRCNACFSKIKSTGASVCEPCALDGAVLVLKPFLCKNTTKGPGPGVQYELDRGQLHAPKYAYTESTAVKTSLGTTSSPQTNKILTQLLCRRYDSPHVGLVQAPRWWQAVGTLARRRESDVVPGHVRIDAWVETCLTNWGLWLPPAWFRARRPGWGGFVASKLSRTECPCVR